MHLVGVQAGEGIGEDVILSSLTSYDAVMLWGVDSEDRDAVAVEE